MIAPTAITGIVAAVLRSLPPLGSYEYWAIATIWLCLGLIITGCLPRDASPVARVGCLAVLWLLLPMMIVGLYLLW